MPLLDAAHIAPDRRPVRSLVSTLFELNGSRAAEEAVAAMTAMVVISNGFGRFHLRVAAVEAARRGALAGFLTGGYPVPRLARWIEAVGLSRAPPIGRFLA